MCFSGARQYVVAPVVSPAVLAAVMVSGRDNDSPPCKCTALVLAQTEPQLFAVSSVCVIHTHLLSQALVQGPIQIARPRYPENGSFRLSTFDIGLGAAPTEDVRPYYQSLSRFSAFGQSLQ